MTRAARFGNAGERFAARARRRGPSHRIGVAGRVQVWLTKGDGDARSRRAAGEFMRTSRARLAKARREAAAFDSNSGVSAVVVGTGGGGGQTSKPSPEPGPPGGWLTAIASGFFRLVVMGSLLGAGLIVQVVVIYLAVTLGVFIGAGGEPPKSIPPWGSPRGADEAPAPGCPVVEWTAFRNWLAAADRTTYLELRLRADRFAMSGDEYLLIGLYERDVSNAPAKARTYFDLATALGEPCGGALAATLDLTPPQRSQSANDVRAILGSNGGYGHFVRGLLVVGPEAFDYARALGRPTPFGTDAPFLAPYSEAEALKDMFVAYICAEEQALEWRQYLAAQVGSDAVVAEARSAAVAAYREGVARYGSDGAFCRPGAGGGDLVAGPGAPTGGRSPGGGLASPRRDYGAPLAFLQGGSQGLSLDPSLLPKDGTLCTGAAGAPCPETLTARQLEDLSRYALQQCRAQMAIGAVGRARTFCERAIEFGRRYGSQSAREAGQLLQAMALTCNYTAASLDRISDKVEAPDPADRPVFSGRLIAVSDIQRALKALGYYAYDVDGKPGPRTFAAVREFQRANGFPSLNWLTPRDTVVLVCSAAETARDIKSQNLLGVMYALGLGVAQNTELALDWFSTAALRGDPNGAYNLALMNGLGVVDAGYKHCPIAGSTDRMIGDYYLKEAARLGHPAATRFLEAYGRETPAERWRAIRDEIGGRLGEGLGDAC